MKRRSFPSSRGAAHVAGLTLAATSLVACVDSGRPTGPVAIVAESRSAAHAEHAPRIINMMDACDPTTFNAAVGPGTCVRNGGVTFQQFLAQLTKHHRAGAWHFAPPNATATVGQALLAINRGGEVHTFTEVEHFGGGMVPLINQLSGNPVPAPECLALEADDFVPPGGTYTEEVEEAGTELYQCCIHPWMRTVLHVKAS